MAAPLPVIKPQKLIKALLKAGFIFEHQTGSHRFYTHPLRPNKIVIVPFHNKDLKRGTLKNILRQAEMKTEKLIKLL